MKLFSLVLAGFLFAGCSGKFDSVATPQVNSSEVKSAINMYKRAKVDKGVQKYAPKELYKASKIANALSSEHDASKARSLAKLLKKQVRIAELTKREYELTDEVNRIIIRRNEAIEDAKHQEDVDDEDVAVDDSDVGIDSDIAELKSSFGGDEGDFVIGGKYFDSDDLVLNSKLKSLISYIANDLRNNPGKSVTLTSYTDGIGSAAYSVDMALRRANRVKEELVDRGVDEDRIKVVPKGAVDFIGSNDSDDGREKNNRIVIKID